VGFIVCTFIAYAVNFVM